MDEEFNIITRAHVVSAIAVIVLGWGIFWAGSQGVRLALDNYLIQQSIFGHTIHNLAQISDSADEILPRRTPNPSPSPSSTYSPSPSPSPSPKKSPPPTILPKEIMPTVSHSSYGSGFLLRSALQNNPALTILIGGDVMFDRGIRLVGQKYGYDSLFTSIAPLFAEANIVAINFDGPVTSKTSKTLLANGRTTKSILFTFATSSAKALAQAGVKIVNIANDHMTDFGLSGLAETKKWLTSDGLQWFGDYKNGSSTALMVLPNGIHLAFVGYNASQKGFDKVLVAVRKASLAGNFVVVMPHWGTQYASKSSALMKSQARQLVVAGAGAIVGAGPHVIMDHQWMGGVPVFYSVGNLLFDQRSSPAVTKGQLVGLSLTSTSGKVSVTSVFIYDTSDASGRGVTVKLPPTVFR